MYGNIIENMSNSTDTFWQKYLNLLKNNLLNKK